MGITPNNHLTAIQKATKNWAAYVKAVQEHAYNTPNERARKDREEADATKFVRAEEAKGQ